MRKIWRPIIWLPTILHNDFNMLAAKLSLEEQLSALATAVREVMHLPRLDELDDDMVELLSNQFHVDFYDPKLSLEDKRDLVRDAIGWHRRKGTASAVEEVAKKVYRDAHVVEWFEYGGEPYYFRILQDISLDDEDTDKAMLDRLRSAVAESKNARSWLEFFGFLMTTEEQLDASDAVWYHLRHRYNDFYDYRNGNAVHDGRPDYGTHGLEHDGTLSFDGGSTFDGSSSPWRFGRFQALDFERLSFALTDRYEEIATPSERALIGFSTAPIADPISVVDTLNFTDIKHARIDVCEPRERVGGVDMSMSTMDDVATLERGAVHVYERVQFDGHRAFDGSFFFTGDIHIDIEF